MFKFEFTLPLIYGCFISYIILKYKLFNLGMNTLTWSIYIVNIAIAYILHKIGKAFDKCLERLF